MCALPKCAKAHIPSASMLQGQAAGQGSVSAVFQNLTQSSYPLGLLRAVLNGKISLVHGDFLKIALGDLLLITTCSTPAQLSHSILQRGKSILALPIDFLTHVQCTIGSTFIYLEAFLSILYNINGFIFSSPLSSQQYSESVTGGEQQRALSTLWVYFGVLFLKNRNI